jgi:hypothetical protein
MSQTHTSQTDLVNLATAADLDPLGADGPLGDLPALNAAADTAGLLHLLRRLLPTPGQVAALTPVDALAAMRDLGMVLGSVKRHGVEPVPAVDGCERVLVELGRRTDMIPRDTVHHYTEWNPRGARQRMYTGDPQETVLIDAVRSALPRLRVAVDRCRRLRAIPPADEAFAALAGQLADDLHGFDEAISRVMAHVRPEFFARGLRPYFEAVRVGGHDYRGPAAAHVPLFLVDLAVWASDHAGPQHAALLDDTRQHTLPAWRELSHAWGRAPSLVAQVTRALAAAGSEPVAGGLRASADALGLVLRTLVVFRGKHLVMARRTYREEVRLYPVGSAGGTVELLHEILELTRRNSRLVALPSPAADGGAGRA